MRTNLFLGLEVAGVLVALVGLAVLFGWAVAAVVAGMACVAAAEVHG